MTHRSAAASALIALAFLATSTVACASGFDFGCEFVSLDLTGALSRVPVALGDASNALLAMLADQGMAPDGLAQVEADFASAIAGVTTSLSSFPTLVPVPLIGGALEIGLPLVIVDEIRISGGMLTTDLVRGIAGVAGVEIPEPLLDQDFDLGEETAHVAAGLDVSAWAVSLEAAKRLDAFLLALNLSAGLDYAGLAIRPTISRQVPAEWEGGIDAALGALHLDDIRAAAFSAHVGARLELGVPFLRLYAEVRLVQPIVEWVGWWDLHVGGLAGSLGVVIRF